MLHQRVLNTHSRVRVKRPELPRWANMSVQPTLILVPQEVEVPMLTEAAEYTGHRAIAVSCTQLGPKIAITMRPVRPTTRQPRPSRNPR